MEECYRVSLFDARSMPAALGNAVSWEMMESCCRKARRFCGISEPANEDDARWEVSPTVFGDVKVKMNVIITPERYCDEYDHC
jgi:hypothetical protein